MSDTEHAAPPANDNVEQAIADLAQELAIPIAASDLQLAGATVADLKQACVTIRNLVKENEELRAELDRMAAGVQASPKRWWDRGT